MRVAYICADRGIPLLGFKGASVHMRQMASALAARGNDVVVACAKLGEGNSPPVANGVVSLPTDGDDQEDYLTELFREHSVEAVLERYSLSSGPARRASARCGVPLVLEINAPLALEAFRYRGLRNLDEALALEGDYVRGADAIVAVSPALADYVSTHDPGGPIEVVRNGVDGRFFRAQTPAALDAPAGSVCIGFVGSMKPWHGISELIEAFAAVAATRPSAHLVLAGAGPEDSVLERATRLSDLRGRVHRLGPVPHDAVPGILAALSLAVAPYSPLPDFYFSPLKVMEYMAAGLPVVFSAIGDLPQLLNGGGIAYPPGDGRALAGAIGQLVDDPQLRRRMGARARSRCEVCTWDRAAAKVTSLLQSVAVAGIPGS
jgi:glycosyltransferase involved in cell wall biosynthesis